MPNYRDYLYGTAMFWTGGDFASGQRKLALVVSPNASNLGDFATGMRRYP